MPELLLVHDPARITPETVIVRSLTLGIGQVVHGLAPWMVERGLDYDTNGYLVVITCGVPEHAARREVLATFKGAAIRAATIARVSDHPPDPPTAREARSADLQRLARKSDLTLAEVKAAIRLLADA